MLNADVAEKPYRSNTLRPAGVSVARELIEFFCSADGLSTYDPYDVWKTRWGIRAKDYFNRHRRIGMVPGAAFLLFDLYLNNRWRYFYTPQEQPVVRAFAALCLLNLYSRTRRASHLASARRHLEWLQANAVKCSYGIGWGLPFQHVVSKTVRYPAGMPLSTLTPYCMEAFLQFEILTGDHCYHPVLEHILHFFDQDLVVMEETHDCLATSYGPMRDRVVTNSVSYTMFALASLSSYLPVIDRDSSEEKVRKLYRFIRHHQQPDGSWFYSPEGKSFIDCFHTCIVLKNVVKTDRILRLDEADATLEHGYNYLKSRFYDCRWKLFRRFSVRNKPDLAKFDLYDNAEMLNLAILLNDDQLASDLAAAIDRHFRRGSDIYSLIDVFSTRKNKNTLRWAVMPYLYALSQSG